MVKRKGTTSDLQNITQKTKYRATRTLLNIWGELRCSGSSCSTCDTRSGTLVINPVISHEWGEDRIVITTNGKNRQQLSTLLQSFAFDSHPFKQWTFHFWRVLSCNYFLYAYPGNIDFEYQCSCNCFNICKLCGWKFTSSLHHSNIAVHNIQMCCIPHRLNMHLAEARSVEWK